VQTRLPEATRVSVRRVYALINPTSGAVGPATGDELTALFAELGLDHRVSELLPGQFEGGVRAAIDADPDLIVVLGGDGTARLVAERCGPRGPLVAPLSGGTMNKLGRALYGAKSWREALVSVLAQGEARWMPGGEVGGRMFYCSAVLGAPAQWALAREAFRAHMLSRAWRRALSVFRNPVPAQLHYEINDKIGRSLAIGLICPTISRALGDDEGALEAAVLDLRDTRAAVRLALNHVFRDWRDDPDVTVLPFVKGRTSSRDSIPAMLDGEFFRFGRQVDARFLPRAFRALAPVVEEDAAA
jgi:diacylglycerol kinase family enzyme